MKANALRKSAEGKSCTLNIPGVCSYNSDTVVLCHYPFEGGKMGGKSPDICAGYACASCHDVIDRRVSHCISEDDREFYMRRSNVRTLLLMHDEGLIKIKGVDY